MTPQGDPRSRFPLLLSPLSSDPLPSRLRVRGARRLIRVQHRPFALALRLLGGVALTCWLVVLGLLLAFGAPGWAVAVAALGLAPAAAATVLLAAAEARETRLVTGATPLPADADPEDTAIALILSARGRFSRNPEVNHLIRVLADQRQRHFGLRRPRLTAALWGLTALAQALLLASALRAEGLTPDTVFLALLLTGAVALALSHPTTAARDRALAAALCAAYDREPGIPGPREVHDREPTAPGRSPGAAPPPGG